jgi:fluoride exporter
MSVSAAGLLYVAAGAALGGALRYAVNVAFARASFPLATLTVNVLGSLAIGAFAASSARLGIGQTAPVWLFAVTGLLGSFTTVSAFSLATLNLVHEGKRSLALVNIAASAALCLAAAALGYAAAA